MSWFGKNLLLSELLDEGICFKSLFLCHTCSYPVKNLIRIGCILSHRQNLAVDSELFKNSVRTDQVINITKGNCLAYLRLTSEKRCILEFIQHKHYLALLGLVISGNLMSINFYQVVIKCRLRIAKLLRYASRFENKNRLRLLKKVRKLYVETTTKKLQYDLDYERRISQHYQLV